LFPFEGGLPLLLSVLPVLWGPGEAQVLFYRIPFVLFSGRCLPLVDGFWPFGAVHAGLCQSIWQALSEEGNKSPGFIVSSGQIRQSVEFGYVLVQVSFFHMKVLEFVVHVFSFGGISEGVSEGVFEGEPVVFVGLWHWVQGAF